MYKNIWYICTGVIYIYRILYRIYIYIYIQPRLPSAIDYVDYNLVACGLLQHTIHTYINQQLHTYMRVHLIFIYNQMIYRNVYVLRRYNYIQFKYLSPSSSQHSNIHIRCRPYIVSAANFQFLRRELLMRGNDKALSLQSLRVTSWLKSCNISPSNSTTSSNLFFS